VPYHEKKFVSLLSRQKNFRCGKAGPGTGDCGGEVKEAT